MSRLADLSDDAVTAEIAHARYFARVAWTKAKAAGRQRLAATRHLAAPASSGAARYYALRRAGLGDEIRMYLCARALYRARLAAAAGERARRHGATQVAA